MNTVRAPTHARSRRRRRHWLVVGVAAAVAVAGCGTRTNGRGSPEPGQPTATQPPTGPGATTTTPTKPTPTRQVGTWRTLPPAPIATAADSVWTGTEVVVVGLPPFGQDTVYPVAGYDPTTNRWRRLASPPPVHGQYEGIVQTVWTGREVVAWGGVLSAAYNPTTNTWRQLPPAPTTTEGYGPGGHVMAWTGRQVVLWGGGCCGGAGAGGAAYTPATDAWRALPAAPLAGRYAAGAWTGHELVIVGGRNGEGTTFRDAAAYSPATGTWRRLPPMPAPRANATATWDGEEVLVVGGSAPVGSQIRQYANGVAYNPLTNRWRELPAPVEAARRDEHVAVCTGSILLVWGGYVIGHNPAERTTPPHGIAYAPASNRWAALPISPLRGRYETTAVWTGTEMIIWGGVPVKNGPYLANGAAYTP